MIGEVKSLIVLSGDIGDLRPLSLLLRGDFIKHYAGCNSEPIGSARHQIGDYALMGLPFVDLSELLNAIHFHSDAILKHVLQLRVLCTRLFREVHWMTPGNLDSGGGLGD
jgi:hypothetical protein